MSKPIYLDREGVDAIVQKIEKAIRDLKDTADEIDEQIYSLEECWRGNAHDKAVATYEESYKDMLTKKLPETVDELNKYVNTCKDKIVEIDNMLAGGGKP